MKTLEGKVAIITGASRGLGKSTASLFAREGAKVVLSARSKTDIEGIAASLRSEGCEAVSFPCDVSDPIQIENLARFSLQVYGNFDIWINNAGTAGPYGHTFDIPSDQFLSVLKTNIFGVFYGSSIAMRHFLPRNSGKLINILGAGSRKPAPNQNAYGSTKSWIRVFTLALAEEYKNNGVGVFVLQPGLMETDLLTDITTFAPFEKRLQSFMPFLIHAAGKKPEIAARKVLWLASSATDRKTGLDISVSSPYAFIIGFLREGFRRLFRLPVRPIEMNIQIISSGFEKLE